MKLPRDIEQLGPIGTQEIYYVCAAKPLQICLLHLATLEKRKLKRLESSPRLVHATPDACLAFLLLPAQSSSTALLENSNPHTRIPKIHVFSLKSQSYISAFTPRHVPTALLATRSRVYTASSLPGSPSTDFYVHARASGETLHWCISGAPISRFFPSSSSSDSRVWTGTADGMPRLFKHDDLALQIHLHPPNDALILFAHAHACTWYPHSCLIHHRFATTSVVGWITDSRGAYTRRVDQVSHALRLPGHTAIAVACSGRLEVLSPRLSPRKDVSPFPRKYISTSPQDNVSPFPQDDVRVVSLYSCDFTGTLVGLVKGRPGGGVALYMVYASGNVGVVRDVDIDGGAGVPVGLSVEDGAVSMDALDINQGQREEDGGVSMDALEVNQGQREEAISHVNVVDGWQKRKSGATSIKGGQAPGENHQETLKSGHLKVNHQETLKSGDPKVSQDKAETRVLKDKSERPGKKVEMATTLEAPLPRKEKDNGIVKSILDPIVRSVNASEEGLDRTTRLQKAAKSKERLERTGVSLVSSLIRGESPGGNIDAENPVGNIDAENPGGNIDVDLIRELVCRSDAYCRAGVYAEGLEATRKALQVLERE